MVKTRQLLGTLEI